MELRRSAARLAAVTGLAATLVPAVLAPPAAAATPTIELTGLAYGLQEIGDTGRAVFAGTEVSGIEPWVTDGTPAGTMEIADVNSGSASGFRVEGTTEAVTSIGDVVLYPGDDLDHGGELWATDGTEAGTHLVKDVWPGPDTGYVGPIIAFGGLAIFSADEGAGRSLWATDGTEAGTVRIADAAPQYERQLAVAGDRVYFVGAGHLWRTDGTAAGTSQVVDLEDVDGLAGQPDGRVAFTAWTPELGDEPYVSDGTEAGTVLLGDLDPGSDGSTAWTWAGPGGSWYFAADTPGHGFEPWRSDGTPAGTHLVTDLRPGPGGSLNDLTAFTAVGDRVVFPVRAFHEVWSTDGTEAGTELLAEGEAGFGAHPFAEGDLAYLALERPDAPGLVVDLWRTDGTAAGTGVLAALPSGVDPERRTVGTVGGRLVVAQGPGGLVALDGPGVYCVDLELRTRLGTPSLEGRVLCAGSDGAPASVALDVPPPAGVVVVEPDGRFAYELPDAPGTYTFTVAATVGSQQRSGTVTVVVTDPLVVTTTADDGEGSLRAAITAANASPGHDDITFAIPGPGPHTIHPASLLPQIQDGVSLDARTQPGYAGLPLVEIDGAGVVAGGVLAGAPDVTVAGLSIHGFTVANLIVTGNRATVVANHIGTGPLGTEPVGDVLTSRSAVVGTRHGRIGGPDPADANVIVGGVQFDLYVEASATLVQGNDVGFARGGSTVLGPASIGLALPLSTEVRDNRIAGAQFGVVAAGDGARIEGNTLASPTAPGDAAAVVVDVGAEAVLLRSNRFGPGAGIDLRPGAGRTANDELDADEGGNRLQNHPVVTAADGTTVAGTLHSTPGSVFTVEVVAGPPGGLQVPVGEAAATTDPTTGEGTWSATLTSPLPVPKAAIRALVTDAGGNTSELSDPIDVVLPYYWDGDGGTADRSWHSAVNWSTDVVPGGADDAVVQAGFDGPLVSAADATVRSLSLASPLDLAAGRALALGDGESSLAAPVTGAGTLSNAGTLSLVEGAAWSGPTLVNTGAVIGAGAAGEETFGPIVNTGLVRAERSLGIGPVSGAGQYQSVAGAFGRLAFRGAGNVLPPGSSLSGDDLVFVDGTLEASDGTIALTSGITPARSGTLVVRGAATASSFPIASGTIVLDGAMLHGDVDTGRGRLEGHGTVDGAVINRGGVVAPDGTLVARSYSGRRSTSNRARLLIDVAGPDVGEYDRLVITGTAELAPEHELDVTLDVGYEPAWGDVVRFLQADGGLTGTFAAVSGAEPFAVRYDATGAELALVDDVDPTIEATVDPAAPDGDDGWYVTAPTVSFDCADTGGSGIASCSGPTTLSSSATAQSVTGTAVDNAGRSASTTVSGLLVDLVDPTVVCSATPTFVVGAAGSVTAVVTDVHSGPAAGTASSAVVTTTPGSFTAQVTGADVAGRTTTIACPYVVGRIATDLVASPIVTRNFLGLITSYRPSAVLTVDATGAPIAGQPVVLTLPGRAPCAAVTDAGGRATCGPTFVVILGLLGGGSFGAAYAGSTTYLPSSATGTIP